MEAWTSMGGSRVGIEVEKFKSILQTEMEELGDAVGEKVRRKRQTLYPLSV